MLDTFKYWNTKDKWKSEELETPNNQEAQDDYRNIRERIRHCLDDDYDNIEVDHTLNMMHDETERWEKSYPANKVEDNEFYGDLKAEEQFPIPQNQNDEMMGYCLRLERNNAYLLQMIEKFEQVSFKKRYTELLSNNTKLQEEYSRLKDTNTKVYNSYCDLIDENKSLKSSNKELKQKLKETIEGQKDLNHENRKLVSQLENYKREDVINKEIIKEHQRAKTSIQKTLSTKETEIIKLKAANIATKLKLEKIETLVLKQDLAASTEMKIDSETSKEDKLIVNNRNKEEEKGPKEEEPETEDTIIRLQQKYKTKLPV